MAKAAAETVAVKVGVTVAEVRAVARVGTAAVEGEKAAEAMVAAVKVMGS